MRIITSQTRLGLAVVVLYSFLVSCTTSANSEYFGRNVVPQNNIMRYISGSEPESLELPKMAANLRKRRANLLSKSARTA